MWGNRMREDAHPEILGGKWGRNDKAGKMVVPLIYLPIRSYSIALKKRRIDPEFVLHNEYREILFQSGFTEPYPTSSNLFDNICLLP
jgi:hypothetical protein